MILTRSNFHSAKPFPTIRRNMIAPVADSLKMRTQEIASRSILPHSGHHSLNLPDRSVYVGESLHGNPHGIGKCVFPNGAVYEGAWENGKKHGQGSLTFLDGQTYEGTWIENRQTVSKLTFVNGSVYEGELLNGRRHGRGIYKSDAGMIVYDGEWKDDEWNGRGIWNFGNGKRYEGEFLNEKRHGQGILQTDRLTYEGSWINDRWEGEGTLSWSNGALFKGSFVEDAIQGRGIFRYDDGTVYEGDFVNSESHGQGICKYTDGSVYEGDWVGDLRHGYGVWTFPNGAFYKGNFANHKPNGKGTWTHVDGSVFTGDVVNGDKNGYGVWISPGMFRYDGYFANNKLNGSGRYSVSCGSVFEGNFVENSRHGKGIYTFDKPGHITIREQLEYYHGRMINLNKSRIGDLWFFCLLFGLDCGPCYPEYPLGIMASYLADYFRHDEQVMRDVVNPLLQASELNELYDKDPDLKKEKLQQAIYGVKEGVPFLLPYGYSDHSMGVYFGLSPNPHFVQCEIYNSGDGLREFHGEPQGNRFQCMKKIWIPIEEFTVDKLRELQIHSYSSLDIDEAYNLLLVGAKEVPLNEEESKVWKLAQKKEDCHLAWIKRFLAYKLPKIYPKVRQDLYRDCIEAAFARAHDVDVLQFKRVHEKLAKVGLVYV